MLSTFDCLISTFTSLSGGRLISSACGVRNTVVTMKKMRRRNATSTIGVMSMRTPTRRLGRLKPLPFFLLALGCGVSTAAIGLHLLSASLARRLLEDVARSLEIGLDVEARGLRVLERTHHVGHYAVGSVLVH